MATPDNSPTPAASNPAASNPAAPNPAGGSAGLSATSTVRLKWGEVDAFGIIFYPTYYRWFDQATLEMFRPYPALNFKQRFVASGEGWPLVECGAKFLRPALFDDELTITSTVVDIARKVFRVEHVVRRGDDEVARGFEVRAFAAADPSGRISAAVLPDDVRAALSGLATPAP